MRTTIHILILALLSAGFLLLFGRIRILERAAELLRRTRKEMEGAARRRGIEERQKLLQLTGESPLWNSCQRLLYYTGLKSLFPELTAEVWIAGNLALTAALGSFLLGVAGPGAMARGLLVLYACEAVVLEGLRYLNLRRVEENMMKLLDFLGNYSLTAGEVTGIFRQISPYMEEPLRSALEGCYYEAGVTGDTGLALLSMAEKIEHPKFKELVRNMEVGLRYSADFTALVSGGRRSLREYLRAARERRGLLRDSFIGMGLLLGMSAVILLTVCALVQISISQLLFQTLPGKLGLAAVAFIGLLFLGQVSRAGK